MTHSPFTSTVLYEGERLDEVNERIHLIQNSKGLMFGTDAYLLAAYVKKAPSSVAVELGGGTGIVSLLLAAKGKLKQITTVEIQTDYADLIERNIQLNELKSCVHVLCKDVRDLCASDLGGEVDLVVSNPPYMRTDSGKRNVEDEKYIARHEVCGGINDFCASAARILRYGGKFVCVWRPDRLSELFSALHASSLEPKRMIMVHADLQSEPCMVLLESVKGGAPSMRISPPLLLYREKKANENRRELTDQAKAIYDTCSF